jgi:hypothetical protein
MTNMDDLQVLTTSIGEYTVDTLGRENLRGLQVTMDRRNLVGHIAIALQDNTDMQQKSAIKDLLEIEQMYFDEAVLSFSFVEEIDADSVATSSVPQYSLA